MIPDIDALVGMGVYSTGFAGTGGRIKGSPEDFEVSEILSAGALPRDGGSGGWAVYRLKKRRIDTTHAVADIQRRSGIRLRCLGLKDASAVTEQFACARGRSVGSLSGPRYSLERIGFAPGPLAKGDMEGNRFRVRIRGCTADPGGFAEYGRILNFFGHQRFGSRRPVTHLVGRAITRGLYCEAVRLITSFESPHDAGENNALRRRIGEEDPAACLGWLPRGMDIERAVLAEMASSGDPARAVRAVPLQMRRFYVQAYQSYIFNRALSDAYAAGEGLFAPLEGDVCFGADGAVCRYSGGAGQRLALPLAGHSYYAKTRFESYVGQVMEAEGASHADFFCRGMQEAGAAGGFRQASAACTGCSASGGTVEFSLSRGSFATVVLREIIKPADPVAAGF